MGQKAPKKVSSYLSRFLKILTKPQRKHFLLYLVGLIYLVKFRSTREIAHEFGGQAPDNLQHFLNASPKKTEILQENTQEEIALATDPAILVIDDTPCPRDGEKIEGTGIHHGADGFVKGQCAVTSILKVGTQRFLWAIRGYRPKKACPEGQFKSKIQIAREILGQARRCFTKPLTVLIDAWYTCAPILNPIQEAGWTFLAAIKRNRILEIDGRKTVVNSLAKGPRTYKTIRISKKRRFKVAQRLVRLPKVGMVLLFISKSRHETRFFVTNNLEMTESEMGKLYAQRFGIETFHKEIKQYLGFGEMFMRSWDGAQTHWALVGIAYNLIVLGNGKNPKSFRQKIRHFRKFVSHESIIHLPKQLRIPA